MVGYREESVVRHSILTTVVAAGSTNLLKHPPITSLDTQCGMGYHITIIYMDIVRHTGGRMTIDNGCSSWLTVSDTAC